MALQHTRHVLRRSDCTHTVLRSLIRTVGHQIPQISTPLTITCVGGHAGKVSQTAAEAKDDRRAESRFTIRLIWDDMPQEPINKAVKDFTKHPKACVQVNGGHFEHLM